MTESGTHSTAITWSVPECPFSIESSARVLDDIRLAVTDAFFSLPKGGAEIGGILLGVFDKNLLVISDHAPLDCEHAYGPSFVLSPADETRLTELIATRSRGEAGVRPVGWYHSHTRSEIFLSDADLAIQSRYFPEPWQVALVMKPHTFQPARIGFFFRQADGSIQSAASYREQALEALPMRQLPAGPPAASASREMAGLQHGSVRNPGSLIAPRVDFASIVDIVAEAKPLASASFSAAAGVAVQGLIIGMPATTAGPPQAVSMTAAPGPTVASAPPSVVGDSGGALATAQPATDLQIPKFAVQTASSARRWMVVGVGLVACLGVIGAGFKTRGLWLPRALAAARPAPAQAAPPPALGLKTIDQDGQLQITWDGNSAPVRGASSAVLEISEGGPTPRAIPLDSAHLAAGSFTYARNVEKLDVKLIVHRQKGGDIREATSFLGKLPNPKPAVDPGAQKQRDEMASQSAKIKAELNSQAEKTRKLEKDLQAVRLELLRERQRRLNNQVPDK